MTKFLFLFLSCVCMVVHAAELAVVTPAQENSSEFPTESERNEERERLTRARQALEDRYRQDMKLCYQQFDVNTCRLEARDRRIEANALLRQDELRFNAQERLIHAEETRRSVAERNSEAEQKKAQAQRAESIATAKDRANANAQKQIDHALQGTKRGDYEQKQLDAAQHRADVEKKMRERTKEPAAPLPVMGR